MKKWEILSKLKNSGSKFKKDQLIKVLLQNRGVVTKKEIDLFLNPKLGDLTIENVGIDKLQLAKTLKRIKEAIKTHEQIVVFGDYDVDGICGSAILWETLNSIGAKVLPYIPHRIDEGYGLSIKGIENLSSQIPDVKLIITVDNGIVANNAVDFAKNKGVDVIITDHHVAGKKIPDAFSLVHTTKLCGTGVAWMLSQKLFDGKKLDHLELAALATVADLVPLMGANRAIVKFGIEALHKTKRLGLLELFKAAGIEKETIGVYEIGHMIAPRLNAMGRLESAMDSLRLLCTNKKERAMELAVLLSSTNVERQTVTEEAVFHAVAQVERKKEKGRILFIAHESYQQGVVGLVAGKLVEKYYLPSIVVSKGETMSRASARSISGFNIIEFIRLAGDLLVDAGGHPMAAGFTVETSNLLSLQKRFEELIKTQLKDENLNQTLRIDCELSLLEINMKLYDSISSLSPFGMANPIPTFLSKNAIIEDMRLVGKEGKHLKIEFRIKNSELRIQGIGFGMGEKSKELKIGDSVDIVYTIDENVWNGRKSLQLKIKDIKETRL